MPLRFRKSRSFGPFRLTLSKRGVGASFGVGPGRVSVGADGKVRETVRLLPGLWWQSSARSSSRTSNDGTPARGPRGVLLFAVLVALLFAAYFLFGGR